MTRLPGLYVRPGILVCLLLALPAAARAQVTFPVGDDAALRAAVAAANPGDTIRFTASITLLAELPSIAAPITIDGNGHTLSGGGAFRGLTIANLSGEAPAGVSVTIQDLAIANTVARGGTGGSGTDGGGGGGAGLGGAIYVADQASLTLRNVAITSSTAVGGAGGAAVGGPGGGGGGGVGGDGGPSGGGGGGFGLAATGGGVTGGTGILTGSLTGGGGGANTGGGGDGGGAGGSGGGSGVGGTGGYGGGGGAGAAGGTGSIGGFGGGGGGGDLGAGGGGFGGGGGGTQSGSATLGNFGGSGAAGLAAGGGGGAGLGGAIFVEGGGSLTVEGTLTIGGNSVTGGAGVGGGGNGQAFGDGIFLQDGGTLTFNQAAGVTATVADSIEDEHARRPPLFDVGIWSVQKTGAGTLVLAGANLYSGFTDVIGGTLSVASDTNLGLAWTLGGGNVIVRDGATLDITGSNTFERGLVLEGVGTVRVGSGISAVWNNFITDNDSPSRLRVTGGGTLSLGNNTNSFSGGLAIVGNSTVQFTDDGALGLAGSGVQLGDLTTGGTLRLTGGTVVSTRNFTLGGPSTGTLDVASGAELTVSGLIGGSGTLAKAGAGTLVLSAANTYAGGTQVQAGTLRAGAADVFGTGRMDVLAGATLDLNGFGQTLGSLAGGGNVTLGSAVLAAGTDNTSTTFGGVMSGTGSFVKLGTGTLTLTGANTYSGGTIVSQGTLVGNATSLQGDIQSSTVLEFNQTGAGTYGGILSGTGSLTKSGTGTLTLLGANTYSGGTTISGGILEGNTTSLQGNIVNNAAIRFDQAATGTYGGVISGSGSFIKSGAGTLTLATSHTFTGPASIAAGVLRAGTSEVFLPTTAISVAAGATFDLNGFNQTIGSMTGAGGVALGSATLTTGGDNTATTLSGVISGTGSLVKTGTGALTLLGANTYSGGTTVSAGSLVGNTTSLQGNILNNALVRFDQTFTGTYAGSITGTGSLTKSGTGTLTLTGLNTYTGGTSVTAGTLVGTSTSLRGSITNGGLLVFNQAADGTFNGSLSGTGSLQKLGAGTLTLASTNALSGGTTISAGVLRAGAGSVFSSSGAIAVGPGATLDLNGFDHTLNALSGTGRIALGNATLTTGTNGASATIGSVISGPGSLVKAGSGTLTLTGANTYTGGTTVSGGILLGDTTSLQGDILNNARVVFGQGFDGTYAGSMSGAGILEKAGSGTLTLTGTNTHTGGTLISGGSIVGTTASLGGAILNNSFLTFGGPNDGAFTGTLGGIGSLAKTGPGTMTLNGSHPFAGLTTVSQGTLALNGTLGGSVVVAPGASFVANGALFGTLTLNGTLGIPTPGFALASAAAGSTGPVAASSGDRLVAPPLLTIDGNLVAGPGSLLSLPVGPGPNPTLFVNGVAALNGTTLDARPIDLGPERNLSYLAMTAAGGLTVANSTVETANPLLLSSMRSDGNTLAVTIVNLGVPLEFAVAPAFAPLGAALDRTRGDLTGDRGFVIRELLALPDDELNAAMRQIAGEVHATNRHIEIRSSEAFTDLIRNQMTERDHEEEEGRPGWGGPAVRWFGQLSREHVSFAPRDGAVGGGADLTDGAGGFEFKVSDRLLVGGGGGLGFGSMALDGLSAGSDYAAPRAFGVVGFKPKGFGIRGGGSVSRSRAKSTRTILIVARLPQELGGAPLTGGINREARSEEVTVQSDQWSEYADHRDFGTYRLDYMFGVRRARFARDNFVEDGAGSLSLEYDGGTLNLTDADVKVHWWRRRGGVRPYIETFFRRSSGFDYTLPVEFADDEDSDFVTAGLPMGQSAFAGRLGVTFVRRIGSFTFEYRIRKAAGQTAQTADFRFRF